MNPFDHIKNLHTKKRRWEDFNDEEKKSFNVFIINKGLSMNPNYLGIVNMPKGLDFGGGIGAEDTAVQVKGTGEGIEAFTMGSELRAVHNANGRRVRGFCSEITMPNRDTTIKEVRHGNAPPRKHVLDFNSADITATFYLDKFLRERSYFELWQQAAFSTKSFNKNYK